MLRFIASVAAGYLGTGVLIVLTDLAFAALTPGFKSISPPPLYYFVTSLVTDTVYSVAGGYLCAVIARAAARKAAIGVIVVGELMGLVSTVALWGTAPHWFSLGLLAIYPPAVWIGAQLRLRSNAAAQ